MPGEAAHNNASVFGKLHAFRAQQAALCRKGGAAGAVFIYHAVKGQFGRIRTGGGIAHRAAGAAIARQSGYLPVAHHAAFGNTPDNIVYALIKTFVVRHVSIILFLCFRHTCPRTEFPPSAGGTKCYNKTNCVPIRGFQVKKLSFSYSKMGMYQECPQKYKFRYVHMLPEQPKYYFAFGSALHEALHQFVSEYPNNTDEQLLSNLFKMHLEKYPFTQTELSFYEPQLKRIAKWFVNQQENRLKFVQKTITEQVGQVILQPKGAPFELVCRADRIDVLKNQAIEIIDYKTGTVPKPKEIKYAYEPQLPLEAYILSQKGFENISPLPVQALTYWKMSGKEGASQITSAIAASDKKTTVQTLTQEAVQKLLLLIDTFDNPKTAYESCPLPSHIPHYNDYAYLARIQEWKHADDEGDDE